MAETLSFLLQLRGICAEHEVPVPPTLDKALFAWLHAAAASQIETSDRRTR